MNRMPGGEQSLERTLGLERRSTGSEPRTARTDRRTLLAAAVRELLIEQNRSPDPDDAYLLWHLGLEREARRAFEIRARSGAIDANVAVCVLGESAEDVARVALECLSRLPSHDDQRDLARLVWSDLWLRRGRSELATAFARSVLTLEIDAEIWPVPTPAQSTASGMNFTALDGWLRGPWRTALQRRDWGRLLRLMVTATLAGVHDLPAPNVPINELPWPLAPWFIDREGSLSASAITALADRLDDPAEAVALEMLGCDFLEAKHPEKAGRELARIAASGSDHLAAYARLRAQRAQVRAGNFKLAGAVALDRLDYVNDRHLVVGLLLNVVLYALWEQDVDEGTLRASNQLAAAARSFSTDHPNDPCAKALQGLVTPLRECLQWVYGGRRALAEFYRDLARGGGQGSARRLQAIYLEEQAQPLVLVTALREAIDAPARLPALFGATREIVPDAELGEVLQRIAERHPDVGHGTASVRRYLNADAELSASDEARLEAADSHRDEVLTLLRVAGDDAARVELLARLKGSSSELRGALALLRCREFMSRGRATQAQAAISEAAAALGLTPTVESMTDEVTELTGDIGLRPRIEEVAARQNLDRALANEPAIARLWETSVALGREGRWTDGAEHLLEAGRNAENPWISARMFATAIRWLDDHARDLRSAIEAAAHAFEVCPGDLELARAYAGLLVRTGWFRSLSELIKELLAPTASRDFGPSDVLDDDLARTIEWASRRAAQSDETDHTALTGFVEMCLLLPLDLRSSVKVSLLGSQATLMERSGGREAVLNRLRYAVGSAETPEETAGIALLLGRYEEHVTTAGEHLVAALGRRESRTGALEHLIALYEVSGDWDALVSRVLAKADELAADDGRDDLLLFAAAITVDRSEDMESGSDLLRRVTIESLTHGQLEELDRLATRVDDADVLGPVLAARIDQETTPMVRAGIRERIALLRERQGNSAAALELRLEALSEAPPSLAAVERLEREVLDGPQPGRVFEVYETAIETLSKRTDEGALIAQLHVRRAELELERFDDPDGATKSLLDALRAEPGNDEIRDRVIALATDEGEVYVPGIAWEIQVASIPASDPQRYHVLVGAAASHAELGAMGRALPLYAEAFELDPSSAEVAELLLDHFTHYGETREAIRVRHRHAETLVEHDPAMAAELWMTNAHDQVELRRYQDAIGSLERAREVVPGHRQLYHELGSLYAEVEDWDAVLEITRLTLERFHLEAIEEAQLRVRVGQVHLRQLEHPVRASQAFRRALDLVPDHVPALIGLRDLLATRNDWADAVPIMERLAELAGSPEERAALHVDVGQVAMQHLDDIDRARRHASQAENLAPELPVTHDLLLDLALYDENWESAKERLHTIAADPQVVRSLNVASLRRREGILTRALGDAEAAFHILMAALELDPGEPRALEAALDIVTEDSAIYDRVEHHLDDLAALLEVAVDSNENDTRAVANLVDILIHQSMVAETRGRTGLALEALERAARYVPDHVGVWESMVELLLRNGRAEDALTHTLDLAAKVKKETRAWRRAMQRAGELALDALGDGQRAVDILTELRQRAPGDLDASYALARAWYATGDLAAAHRQMERVTAAYQGADPREMAERVRHSAADHHVFLGSLYAIGGDPQSRSRALEQFTVARSFANLHAGAVLATLNLLRDDGSDALFNEELASVRRSIERSEDPVDPALTLGLESIASSPRS